VPLFLASPRAKPSDMKRGLDLHGNKPVGEKHFHLNGFARGRFVVTQSQRHSGKWPITSIFLACQRIRHLSLTSI